MYTVRLITLLLALYVTHADDLHADFTARYGDHFHGEELKQRFRTYEESKRKVDEHNKDPSRRFNMALNQFSVQTPAELDHHRITVNMTETKKTGRLRLNSYRPLTGIRPTEVDHVEEGLVTRVKDQRSCGCSWAFAFTAAFEAAYAQATRVLKSFSEKELLDCVYEGQDKDGCKGGRPTDAAWYISKGKRLADMEKAPYDYAKDRACNYGSVPNGLKNFRSVVWHLGIRNSPSAMEIAAQGSVLTVGIILEVDDPLFRYKSGLYDGCPTTGDIGHYVAMVGYTQDSWKVKNSWGRFWGEGGYIRFDRSVPNNCRIKDLVQYATVHVTGLTFDESEVDTYPRTREPGRGCSWDDDYPCSDMNCNYGCGKKKKCWRQCNGECGDMSTTGGERCADCDEWCWLERKCKVHEDCEGVKHEPCPGDCTK